MIQLLYNSPYIRPANILHRKLAMQCNVLKSKNNDILNTNICSLCKQHGHKKLTCSKSGIGLDTALISGDETDINVKSQVKIDMPILPQTDKSEHVKLLEEHLAISNIKHEEQIMNLATLKETTNASTISLDYLEEHDEEKKFIEILNETYSIYFTSGPRSSDKVNHFHLAIKNMLEPYFPKVNNYDIKLEYEVKSSNSAQKKKCDIVILHNKTPYIIIPVKIVMTNYKKNKNNYWEQLTGESSHIMWQNPNIKIIPITIIANKCPSLLANKQIKCFENVEESDVDIYRELINKKLCYDVINYIVDIKHSKKEGEQFNDILPIEKLITKYRQFKTIFTDLII